MVCQWGYSMTLQQFARIVKISAKTMLVELLENKHHETVGFLAETVMPSEKVKTNYEGVIKTIRLYPTKGNENSWVSKKNGYGMYYELWDGEPKYENHAD